MQIKVLSVKSLEGGFDVGDKVELIVEREKTQMQPTTETVVGTLHSFEADRIGNLLCLSIITDKGPREFRHGMIKSVKAV